MKKMAFLMLLGCFAVLLPTGCAKRMPSEDIEVPDLCIAEIAVLKNPNIPSNSKAKYEAARSIVRKVDFTFTRETKTLDGILYFGDGVVVGEQNGCRTIVFNYQYGDKYVRLEFVLYRQYVLRVTETEK